AQDMTRNPVSVTVLMLRRPGRSIWPTIALHQTGFLEIRDNIDLCACHIDVVYACSGFGSYLLVNRGVISSPVVDDDKRVSLAELVERLLPLFGRACVPDDDLAFLLGPFDQSRLSLRLRFLRRRAHSNPRARIRGRGKGRCFSK